MCFFTPYSDTSIGNYYNIIVKYQSAYFAQRECSVSWTIKVRKTKFDWWKNAIFLHSKQKLQNMHGLFSMKCGILFSEGSNLWIHIKISLKKHQLWMYFVHGRNENEICFENIVFKQIWHVPWQFCQIFLLYRILLIHCRETNMFLFLSSV